MTQPRLMKAACDLLEDVQRRYLGEELRSRYVRALDEAVSAPRATVYDAIDGERDYQDNLPPERTDGKQKTVGDYITMMGSYYDRALVAWVSTPGNEAALHVVRKIAAIGVRCMEEHGALHREVKLTAKDPVHKSGGMWFFWDETWSQAHGPYPSEDLARRALTLYGKSLNGEAPQPEALVKALDERNERRVPRYEGQPSSGNTHASDCATHDAPAKESGECNCGPVDPIKAAHESAMDAYGFKDGDHMEWLDIGNEAQRTYVYADGSRYRVVAPLQLNVTRKPNGDSHRIRTRNGNGVYVAPFWIAIEWRGHDGGDATAF